MSELLNFIITAVLFFLLLGAVYALLKHFGILI